MNRFILSALIGLFSLLSLLSCDKNELPPKILSVDLTAIKSISVLTTVKLVNADTISRLPIHYKVLDKNGKQIYYLEDKIQLYANGVLQPNSRYFSTGQAQTVILEARLGNLLSAAYLITARALKEYPLVKLPLIFHIPKNIDLAEAAVSLDKVIKDVNNIYRNRKDSLNPNVADTYLEFYLATRDPSGKLLPQPGINYLDVASPTTRDSAEKIAVNVLHEWCAKNYLNIFVDVNFFKGSIPDQYSASFNPGITTTTEHPTCEELNKQILPHHSIPAISLYNEYSFSSLAHELGHFMGLYHTFDAGCFNPDPFLNRVHDTPTHTENFPENGSENGLKFDCNRLSFFSTNVMDYYVLPVSFTQDQVAIIRQTIAHPYYLPL